MFGFLFGKSRGVVSDQMPTEPPAKATAVHWVPSEAHLVLLANFVKPKLAGTWIRPHWSGDLNESPSEAIHRLVGGRLLSPLTTADRLHLACKVPELKEMLRDRALAVSGMKDVLIERLLEADPVGMAAVHARVEGYRCTPEGLKRATDVVERAAARGRALGAEALIHIDAGDYVKAAEIAKVFHASRLLTNEGASLDPEPVSRVAASLAKIMTGRPRILFDVPETDWSDMRRATALWRLGLEREGLVDESGGSPRLGPKVSRCMLLFYITRSVELDRAKQNGIEQLEILNGRGDCCPACNGDHGRSFRISDCSELPHPDCTNHQGCGCTFLMIKALP